MKKITLILLIFLLILPVTLAADINGYIYDINLNLAKDTILKINTIPEQTYVSKDGSYTFTINPGNYIITAEYKEHTIKKEIQIIEEGSYVLDIILSDIPVVEPVEPKEGISYWWYISILLIVIILFYSFYKPKPKKKQIQEDELPKKIIKFIKEQGGRTTQKDIRKEFQSLSEAKVSLAVTELEHRKQIQKIKKGRGNIIVSN